MNIGLVISGYMLVGLGFLFIDILVPDNIWNHLQGNPDIQWVRDLGGEKALLMVYILGVIIFWPSIAYELAMSVAKSSRKGQ